MPEDCCEAGAGVCKALCFDVVGGSSDTLLRLNKCLCSADSGLTQLGWAARPWSIGHRPCLLMAVDPMFHPGHAALHDLSGVFDGPIELIDFDRCDALLLSR